VQAALSNNINAGFEGPDYWGTRMRYCLMVWVDALMRMTCKLTPGSNLRGYQTWRLPSSTGSMSKLPSRLITKILLYAYPEQLVVLPGYDPRRAIGSRHWASVLKHSPDCSSSSVASAAVTERSRSDGDSVAGALATMHIGAAPSDVVDVAVVSAAAADKPATRNDKWARHRIPAPVPSTSTPFAATNTALLQFCAGRAGGAWKYRVSSKTS
jgi:hypothetical protein